jgi:hypothetical protein
MRQYKYRLTITFKSGQQWVLGVGTTILASDLASELNGTDIASRCLSIEKTGRIVWMRPPTASVPAGISAVEETRNDQG